MPIFEYSLTTTPVCLTVPAAPTDLVATVTGNSQITTTWADNSSVETNYVVERSDDNVTFAVVATVGPGMTTYVDDDLSLGETYYYRVKATN